MAFTTTPAARFDIRADDKTKEAFRSVTANLKSATSAANLMRGAVVALGGAVALGVLVKKSLEAADSIGKMADTAGISTKMLQELRYAADLVGVETSVLDKAMGGFNKRVGEARAGTGSLITILQKMDPVLLGNVTAARSAEEAFDVVTEAAAKMTNTMDRSALLAAAFGRTAGTQMALLLKDGIKGLQDMRQEAVDLGLVMDEHLIRSAEQANDDLTRLSTMLKTRVTIAIAELAPYVAAIARSFIEATKNSGGFGMVVVDATETAAISVAYLGNVLHGLDLLLAAQKLTLAEYFEFAVSGYLRIAEGVTWVANLVPGVNLEIDQRLVDSSIAAKNAVADLGIELQDLIEEGLPTDNVRAFFATVREEAAKAAALLEATRGGDQGGGPGGPSAEDQKAAAALEKVRLNTAAQLEVVKASLWSEEEALTQSFLNKMLILEENRELELISLESYLNLKEGLEKQHADKLIKIQDAGLSAQAKQWKEGTTGRLNVLSGVLGSMTVLMNTESRKQFEIGKAAAISQTIIDTYTGAQAAFKALAGIPVVGPALATAAAAAAIAGGLARVSAISSQSFGGGTSAGGTAGVGTATPVVAVDSISGLPEGGRSAQNVNKTDITINLGGAQFLSAEALRTLAEQLSEQVEDGVVIGSFRVAS